MGEKVAVEVFADESVLSVPEWAVYQALARFADDRSRRAWPSNASLCAKTRLSESSVRRACKGLEESGLISRVAREDEHFDGNIPTVVWFLEKVERGVTGTPPTGHCDTPSSRVGGVPVTPYEVPPNGGTYKPLSSLRSERSPSRPLTPSKYFQVALNRAQDEYGAVFTGAGESKVLFGCLKRLRADKISDDEIRQRMDIFAQRPELWNKNIHPTNDFVSKNTQTRLANTVAARARHEAEYSSPSAASREVLPPVTDMAELRAAYEKRMKEKQGTWLQA
jgi:hypothetical protein